MPAVSNATGQVLSTASPVDHSHHLASYDTSLVVGGGVDCGRRRQNVYDRKPQPYAKDNRTAHLTACSDKFVTAELLVLSILRCPGHCSQYIVVIAALLSMM